MLLQADYIGGDLFALSVQLGSCDRNNDDNKSLADKRESCVFLRV